MDLRDLRFFEIIAETGHLGRAAEKVFRSQPALTKCIQRIEADLGVALFERSGRKLTLTPVGEVLLKRARFLRRSLEEITHEVSDFAKGVAGHVRVGSSATTAEFLLPQMTSVLMQDAPSVTMEIAIGMNDVLRTSLREGRLDLVIGPDSGADAQFEFDKIIDDEVVVAASLQHPLFNLSKIVLKDLCGYGWVLPGSSVATRVWLDQVFEQKKLPPPRAQIESNSISLMPRLIARTNLLSFISRKNLGEGKVGALLREVALPATTMRREFGVSHRRSGYLSPAALTILNILKSRGEELFQSE